MKKKLSLVLLFFFVCLNLFAYTVYLAPWKGAGGIPMNPKRDTGNIHYSKITGYIAADGGNAVDPWAGHSSTNLSEGYYTDDEMIVLGGIMELTPFEAASHHTEWVGPPFTGKWEKIIDHTTTLEITATCPNGFYFVSQSNPAYKRPFEIYIIPKIRTYNDAYASYNKFGKERVLSESQYKVQFSYADLKLELFNRNSPSYDHQIWFDMVLVLPGKIKNDVLTLEDGKKYPLTEADDYSAVVTITMKATIPQYNGRNEFTHYDTEFKTITIPFSGFYKPTQEKRDESSVSMYVHPVAAAGNINMRNYGRQQIADLEVMTVVESSKSKTQGSVIFLSSNEDPNKAGDHFKMVKENISYDEPLTDYNSVNYKVYLVDNKDKTHEMEYDGTMFVDENFNSSKISDYKGLVVPPKMPTVKTHGPEMDVWYYSGSIFIEIQDNSAIMMEAGRYTSTVYVHVMGF